MDAEPPPLTSCQLSGGTPGGTKWFRLESESEPIIDDSVAQFQMTLEGNVTLGAPGRCGNGVYIDDGALALPSSDDLWWSLGAGAIMMWVKPEVPEAAFELFSHRSEDSLMGYELFVQSCGEVAATWMLNEFQSNGVSTDCSDVTAGEWTHVALVLGTQNRIYINGRSDGWVVRLDPSRPAETQLVWATLIGAGQSDLVWALAVEDSGIVAVVGDTASPGFPTTAGAFQRTFLGGTPQFPYDSYVIRLDPTRTGQAQLVYSTLFGGSSWEASYAIAVDSDGVLVIGGETDSNDLGMTAGNFDPTYNGGFDGFLIRIDPSLPEEEQYLSATYLGGTGSDWVQTIALCEDGTITVAGDTTSVDFPLTPDAFDSTFGGIDYDMAISRFDPDNSGAAQLVYSTYFGGTENDHIDTLWVDRSGIITFGGFTSAGDYPTTRGAWAEAFAGGPTDATIGRLDPSESGPRQLIYSSLFGGSVGVTGGDEIWDVHVDELGQVVVAGITFSDDFPTTPGAFAQPGAGNSDAFAARFDMLPTGVSAFGNSSPGCGGLLVHSVTSMPFVGNQDFALTCTEAPANGAGLLVLGAGRLPFAIPVLGIELWVDVATLPALLLTANADATGYARIDVPLPPNSALNGATVFTQLLWPTPASPAPCPPQGFSASHGLQITLQP